MKPKTFVGRKEELDTLEDIYRKDSFQMMILYGRRRIGKSTLIKRFIEGKRSVYYSAIKSTMERNIELFGAAAVEGLAAGIEGVRFSSMEDLLTFIGKQSMGERTIVVIDEFPYLAESDKSITSVLQNFIDQMYSTGKMFLILSGSSISFMEDEVLSEKSPLFGRRTSQLKLQPFGYREAAEFTPGYSAEDKALCFGITGGVAKYLELLDDSMSVDENIIQLFFSKSGYLYEETNNLLAQEFRNVTSYSAVIEAIACGSNKLNEIATKSHMDSTNVSHILKTLIATGIVRREQAVTDEKNRKKMHYDLCDHMFRFWYRFVPGGMSAIELSMGEAYYRNTVQPALPNYMADVFEDMCRSYTLLRGMQGAFGCFPAVVGRWWGTDTRQRKQAEIDVVGLDVASRVLVLGECKYRNEQVERDVCEALLEKELLFGGKYRVSRFLLFSKSGFSGWVCRHAEELHVELVRLEDLYLI